MARFGTNAGLMALLWLAQSRSGPPAVGLLTAAFTLPAVFSGVMVGAVLDRMPRGAAIAVDNLGRALLYLAVALLALEPTLPLAAIASLVAAGSLLSPLTQAGILSWTPDLIDEGQSLAAANAAINAIWQIATLLGPAAGGLITATAGPAVALMMQSATYLVCAMLTFSLRGARERPPHQEPVDVLGGLRHMRVRGDLIVLVLFTIAYNFSYAPVEVSLPGFVSHVLGSGAASYGWLWAVFSVGAVVSSALAGLLPRLRRTGLWFAANFLLWGCATLLLSRSHHLTQAAFAMGAGGLIYAPYLLWTTTYIQRTVPEELRGRVFGAFEAFTGLGLPLGALLATTYVPSVGPATALMVAGLSSAVLGIAAFATPALRRLPQLWLALEPSADPSS